MSKMSKKQENGDAILGESYVEYFKRLLKENPQIENEAKKKYSSYMSEHHQKIWDTSDERCKDMMKRMEHMKHFQQCTNALFQKDDDDDDGRDDDGRDGDGRDGDSHDDEQGKKDSKSVDNVSTLENRQEDDTTEACIRDIGDMGNGCSDVNMEDEKNEVTEIVNQFSQLVREHKQEKEFQGSDYDILRQFGFLS